MSIRRGWLAALAVGSVALLGFAGCGSDSKDSAGTTAGGGDGGGTPKSITAFTYFPAGFNDNTQALVNGLQAGGDALGGKARLEIKAMGRLETDAGAFLNYINTGLVTQPDAIIVVPNNAAAMAAGLRKIADDGTKVILTDQAVPGFEPTALVQTDNRAAGRQAAQYLLDQLQAGRLASDEVAILGSTPGISSTDERAAGFKEGLAGSDLKVVVNLAPKCDDSEAARSTMADVLSAHPRLGAVFSVCDTIALGAAKAMEAADRLDVQQVAIDGSRTGVEAIEQGKGVNAEIAQQFFKEYQDAVAIAAAAAAGQTVDGIAYIPTVLVTKDNAAEFLATFAQQSAK